MDIQTSDVSVPQSTAINKPMGLWQRISGVLWVGHQKTFVDIATSPKTFGILVLILALNLVLVLPILPNIKEFTLWTLQNSPGVANLPAAAMSMAATWAVVAALIGAVAGPLLMWLVVAGLLKLFNAFSGEKTSFQSLFTVTVYSYLPVLLSTIIKSALIVATPAQNLNKVSTSLALLLPEDSIGRLYLILSHVDPFVIWSLALLAIGGSVAMKTTIKNTAMFIAVLWVLYVLALGLLTPINKIAGA